MNYCLTCNAETTNPKYCNRSCAAKSNNKGVRRNGKPPKPCKRCGEPLNRNSEQYCSTKCFQDSQLDKRIESGSFSSTTAKTWLIKEYGSTCSVCGLGEWMGQKMPIEIDHIDGNSENNGLTNLRLICPNCHAQTPTYKARNTGNGRHYRRERYLQGKSY